MVIARTEFGVRALVASVGNGGQTYNVVLVIAAFAPSEFVPALVTVPFLLNRIVQTLLLVLVG